MELKNYPADRLKEEILAIVGKYLDLNKYEVFFFGSRVSGKGTDRSDIDVGIEGPEPVPAKAWFGIEEEIENLPMLYKVEIVDFKKVAPIFKEVAMRHLEYISQFF